MANALTLVWSDQPNPASGAVTTCVQDKATTIYRYYQRTSTQPWTLTALAFDHRQAADWQRHRVAPEVADAATAVRLDVLAAEAVAQ
jgi:hypothetical protein